jgi:hypothetical protein
MPHRNQRQRLERLEELVPGTTPITLPGGGQVNVTAIDEIRLLMRCLRAIVGPYPAEDAPAVETIEQVAQDPLLEVFARGEAPPGSGQMFPLVQACARAVLDG